MDAALGPIGQIALHVSDYFEHEPHRVAKMPDHELWMAFLHDPDGNLLALMEEKRGQ